MRYRFMGLAAACLVLTACAAGPGGPARTAVGTQCRATCTQEKATCKGTATACERATAACMANCQELDLLNSR